MGQVEAVCVGTVRPSRFGTHGRSAIDKRPVDGPVRIGTLGLEGDAVADRTHHGGADQAVYAFAREDYASWEHELGRSFGPGSFGENLTTVGVEVQGARIGERWRVGASLLEVAGVRIPCSVFAGFIDEPHWVKRFTRHGVPGAYLRVLEPGTVCAGDAVEVVHVPSGDLTVGYTFRAFTTEPALLPSLAGEERLAQRHRQALARRGLL